MLRFTKIILRVTKTMLRFTKLTLLARLTLLACVTLACLTITAYTQPNPEIKGIYGHPQKLWQQHLRLDSLGINAVFLHHQSITNEFMHQAKTEGAKVFAEFATLNGKGYVETHPEAWAIDNNGQKVKQATWFMGVCPTDSAFMRHRKNELTQLITKFNIDGVWLDYLHWHAQFEDPEPILPETCFCNRCTNLFAKQHKITLQTTNIPQRAKTIITKHDGAWRRWRASVIANWVREMNQTLKKQKPTALLGIYHCPWNDTDFNNARYRILGLDYNLLATHADVFSPMVYHKRMGRSPAWVKENIEWFSGVVKGKKIWPIVQAYDDPGKVTPDELEQVMRNGLSGNSTGIMMFTTDAIADNPAKLDVIKKLYKNETSQRTEKLPYHVDDAQKWWNLSHYLINLTPHFNTKTIRGTNAIKFTVLQPHDSMKIDLKAPMKITSASMDGKALTFTNDSVAYYITMPRNMKVNDIYTIDLAFEGQPKEANAKTHFGGWVWIKDSLGRPWMTVTCQGPGASVWLPCKDKLYDEPDEGVTFTINTPHDLTAVANGRLINKRTTDSTNTFTWQVKNPINNYNIIPSIGAYASWNDTYAGLKGTLDRTYWVLDYNVEKAKKQFIQADTMLKCFEHWLGAYPFYDDGYQLVESPESGMEHQSAVAYGNGFANGYHGNDLSKSGWGLLWDFILIHESGHEWFGNSITCRDAHTWIHEGFTKYLETLYTEFLYGKEAANAYANGISKRIKNEHAVLEDADSDKYNKGSALLHMVRHIIGDSSFRKFLLTLNSKYYHNSLLTPELLKDLNEISSHQFDNIFKQYLDTTIIPTFEYRVNNKSIHYRWSNCVTNFDMPLRVWIDGKAVWLRPQTTWQKMDVERKQVSVRVDENFLVNTKL